MKNLDKNAYQSPHCEIYAILIEGSVLAGSAEPGGLGTLEDNITGEEFING